MRVVRERLNFLITLFVEEGFSQEDAENRAVIVHHYIAGCRIFRPSLPKNGGSKRKGQLDQFVEFIIAPAD